MTSNKTGSLCPSRLTTPRRDKMMPRRFAEDVNTSFEPLSVSRDVLAPPCTLDSHRKRVLKNRYQTCRTAWSPFLFYRETASFAKGLKKRVPPYGAAQVASQCDFLRCRGIHIFAEDMWYMVEYHPGEQQ